MGELDIKSVVVRVNSFPELDSATRACSFVLLLRIDEP
jgi:hypothetical protein